jgi:hypothetical protein
MLNTPVRTAAVIDLATRMNAAQAKWDRLTAADYAAIRTVGALIAAVENHYSLPHDQATRDVEFWLRDVGLQAHP